MNKEQNLNNADNQQLNIADVISRYKLDPKAEYKLARMIELKYKLRTHNITENEQCEYDKLKTWYDYDLIDYDVVNGIINNNLKKKQNEKI